jgi:hypothetical protein
MKKIILVLLFAFLGLVGCSKAGQGIYPAALMWNGSNYSPDVRSPIEESSIDTELGKIEKQVEPMPKKDGQINDARDFKVGNRIFSIKDIEPTEAIAIMKDGKYFKINRIRCSLGIVWDNKMYDFVGNFDSENENVDKELGRVKRVDIDYKDSTNGDITAQGYMGDLSFFPIGAKVSSIKNISTDKAIAVEGKDGKYHKALYIKKVKN